MVGCWILSSAFSASIEIDYVVVVFYWRGVSQFAYAVIVTENFQSFYKYIKTYFKIKYKY